MGILRLAAIALLVGACSSTVEGNGEGVPKVKSHDISVGATVTLIVGDPRCEIEGATPYVCLSSSFVRKFRKAELRGDGALGIVATRRFTSSTRMASR